MDMLQKAIEEITYFSDIFPEEEFQVITANKEEAVPYLREAVEYVLRNRTELEEDYQLYFYAIYLLTEFGDRESFPSEKAPAPAKPVVMEQGLQPTHTFVVRFGQVRFSMGRPFSTMRIFMPGF